MANFNLVDEITPLSRRDNRDTQVASAQFISIRRVDCDDVEGTINLSLAHEEHIFRVQWKGKGRIDGGAVLQVDLGSP